MKKDAYAIRFTFRLPNNLHNLIKETAKARGVSQNALILEILWKHYNR